MAGGGSKKGERRGGRQKGTPNKFNRTVKDMILGALDAKGGMDYLVQQADANPVAFLTLIGKVLPLTIQGDPTHPLTISIMTGVPHAPADDEEDRPVNGHASH